MVAFALKTVFALFTFGVANSFDIDDNPFDTCHERLLNIKRGSMLQLFRNNNCVIDFEPIEHDFQFITAIVDDSCVCKPVIYGNEIHSLGENIGSLAFEPGMQTPKAVFTLFQGENCFSGGIGPVGGRPTTAINSPVGNRKIKFAEICSSPEAKERARKAHKVAEAKAAAKAAGLKHAKGHSTLHSLEDGAKKVFGGVKHDVEEVAADVKMTKTQIEHGLGALGIGAAGIGALGGARHSGLFVLFEASAKMRTVLREWCSSLRRTTTELYLHVRIAFALHAQMRFLDAVPHFCDADTDLYPPVPLSCFYDAVKDLWVSTMSAYSTITCNVRRVLGNRQVLSQKSRAPQLRGAREVKDDDLPENVENSGIGQESALARQRTELGNGRGSKALGDDSIVRKYQLLTTRILNP
ncbi:hypothetical protein BJ138DRAFT_1104038 [Hygrophoropsis aurantiaca]|uniref:Uncharacterized protein n=1 Tax=Hygrophoropsis aurantiaca TaxID=72124 RepID=A0ACB8A440_9AGAM|nr:hypothetical protein BJ138DRAFT_1104038 [Hygrophoropsis aurantiaca]